MSDRDYWERHARNYDLSMALLGGPMKRTVELCAESVRGCDRGARGRRGQPGS